MTPDFDKFSIETGHPDTLSVVAVSLAYVLQKNDSFCDPNLYVLAVW